MDDLISREVAIDDLHGKDPSQIWDTADIEVWLNEFPSAQQETCSYWDSESNICALHRPSAQSHTEEEVQKMQDLEQAGIEKAFELGRQDAMSVIVTCNDCKYSRMTYDGKCKYCDIWFPDEAEYMDGNYYCGSAERRQDG